MAIASDGDGSPPIIRNKNHVLVKGYGRKSTPAKAQYAPLWNWVYEHAVCFSELRQQWSASVGVYGEWIYAEHTLRYDLAPSDFIAYEVYVPGKGFVNARLARASLEEAGFLIPDLHTNSVRSYAQLEALTQLASPWSSCDRREGVMVKVSEGEVLLHRFKMRREDFRPREDFNDGPIRRNRRKAG